MGVDAFIDGYTAGGLTDWMWKGQGKGRDFGVNQCMLSSLGGTREQGKREQENKTTGDADELRLSAFGDELTGCQSAAFCQQAVADCVIGIHGVAARG